MDTMPASRHPAHRVTVTVKNSSENAFCFAPPPPRVGRRLLTVLLQEDDAGALAGKRDGDEAVLLRHVEVSLARDDLLDELLGRRDGTTARVEQEVDVPDDATRAEARCRCHAQTF